MAELESPIEQDCVKWAVERGWYEHKNEKLSKRAVPDRFFARRKDGVRRVVFVEFKRPGETSTPQQQLRQQELRDAGLEVYEFDNREDFYARMR